MEFRERVLSQIELASRAKRTSFYGVERNVVAPNGDTADATFWYADDETSVILLISEQGFNIAALERVIDLADSIEDSQPDEGKGFSRGTLIVPGNYLEAEAPTINGYHIWDMFGLDWFTAFGISRN